MPAKPSKSHHRWPPVGVCVRGLPFCSSVSWSVVFCRPFRAICSRGQPSDGPDRKCHEATFLVYHGCVKQVCGRKSAAESPVGRVCIWLPRVLHVAFYSCRNERAWAGGDLLVEGVCGPRSVGLKRRRVPTEVQQLKNSSCTFGYSSRRVRVPSRPSIVLSLCGMHSCNLIAPSPWDVSALASTDGTGSQWGWGRYATQRWRPILGGGSVGAVATLPRSSLKGCEHRRRGV